MSAILDKKQPITATLAGLRTKLQNEWSQLERDLNMREHILKSIKNHPWEWAGCASLFGWLLSRIPVRKKRSIFTAQVKSGSNIVAVGR
jgi:hypothetical protein